jgi:outer membrane protein OmpA-like peptidoglycan-associated protein
MAAPLAKASGQERRLSLRASTGVGAMLSSDQRSWMGLNGTGVSGAAIASYGFADALGIEARVSGSYFVASNENLNGGMTELGLGTRLAVALAGRWARLEVSAHVNAAWTGPHVVPSLDAALGLGFAVSETLTMGPELIFDQVLWPNDQFYSTDARFLTCAVFLAWHPELTPSPPPRNVQRIERERTVRVVTTPPLEHHSIPPPDDAALARLLDQALPRAQRQEVLLIPPVLFATGSSHLLPAGEVALHAARELIAEMMEPVVVEGHADGRGDQQLNRELSLARASTVRDWLIAHGIEGTRLSVEAHGEGRPLEDGESERTRQINRRVTFRVERIQNAGGRGAEAEQ